jgi:uncharacterized lipoprotein YehR (DUF1307 family)
MSVKITIKNKSSRDIPQELVEEIQFKTLDEINSIAEQYNLKVTEMTNEYKNAKLVEQELTFGDRYAKEN